MTLSNSVLPGPVAGEDYEVDERFGEVTGPFSGVSLEMVDGLRMGAVSVTVTDDDDDVCPVSTPTT